MEAMNLNLSELKLCSIVRSSNNWNWSHRVFRYDLSDGEIYRGETFVLGDRAEHLKVMIGEDQTVYYVEVRRDELSNENTFSCVRIGEFLISPIERFNRN